MAAPQAGHPSSGRHRPVQKEVGPEVDSHEVADQGRLAEVDEVRQDCSLVQLVASEGRSRSPPVLLDTGWVLCLVR